MDRIEELEAENARLRDQVDKLHERLEDIERPNVLLLKGKLTYYGDKYCAWRILAKTGSIFLAEALEKFRDALISQSGGSNQITLSWHVSDEEKSYAELEMAMVSAALGALTTKFSHRYSDLSGYLWTNETIELNGHDVLAEISNAAETMENAWLVLRAEVHI